MLKDSASLAEIYTHFDAAHSDEEWQNWEPETLLFEGAEASSLLLDKVWIIKNLACVNTPSEMATDPLFFLHVCDVVNGNSADFEFLPQPNSLEVAWGIMSLKALFKVAGWEFVPDERLSKVCAHVLIEDGYRSTPSPFEFVSDYRLSEKNPIEDKSKVQAIFSYVGHMASSI